MEVSDLNSPIEKWRGYAWDLPSGTIVEKKYKESELSLRRLLYARVLSQLEPESIHPTRICINWCCQGYEAGNRGR